MAKKGDLVVLKERAKTQYPKWMRDKKLTVTAVENYGVFVDGFGYIILSSDIDVL